MAIPYSGDSLQTDKRKRMLNEIFLHLFTCTYKFYRVYLHAENRTIIFFYSFILYVQVCLVEK